MTDLAAERSTAVNAPIRDDDIIRHLHFCGRPLETLDKSLAFDIEKGSCKVMEMPVRTRI